MHIGLRRLAWVRVRAAFGDGLVVVCSARRSARVVRGLLRAFLYLSIYPSSWALGAQVRALLRLGVPTFCCVARQRCAGRAARALGRNSCAGRGPIPWVAARITWAAARTFVARAAVRSRHSLRHSRHRSPGSLLRGPRPGLRSAWKAQSRSLRTTRPPSGSSSTAGAAASA